MASKYLKEKTLGLPCSTSVLKAILQALAECVIKVEERAKKKLESPQKRKKAMQQISLTYRDDRLQPKFVQKEYMLKFKEKAEENKSFAVKLLKEQAQRKHRQERREEKIRQKLLQEINERELEKMKLEEMQEKAKQGQLNAMLEKSRARKQNLVMMKEIAEKEYRKAISATPLYKKIESHFLDAFEIPELEKRKEELRKKREMFRPIDYEQLREHAKQVDLHQSYLSEKQRSLNSKLSIQGAKSLSKSMFMKKIIEDERLKEMEEQAKIVQKRNLMAKQKQYADIVKEVFQPTLDVFKKKEMELIIERSNHPVTIKSKATPTISDEERRSDIGRSISYSPRKFQKNKMIAEKPAKKIPVIKDYLEEFREARKRKMSSKEFKVDWENDLGLNISNEEKQKRLKRKAEIFDREARKNEIKMGFISPYNHKCLEVSEHVNDLLVNSIRAKLAILENN